MRFGYRNWAFPFLCLELDFSEKALCTICWFTRSSSWLKKIHTPQPQVLQELKIHEDVVDLCFFSLLIPINEICHVALSYLRMYACSPGTLWGEHPSKQVGSIVQHLGRNI